MGGPGGPQGPPDFIAKQLDFDETQMKEFVEIDKSHREKHKNIIHSLEELKGQLFSDISKDSISETKIDSIATLIGNKEKEKEMEVFYFFKKIKSICNDKQKKQFENLMKDALPKRGDRPRPPRRK